MENLKVFKKNGFDVNAVYVVQPGDKIHLIEKKIQQTGGNPQEIYKIDPSLKKGKAPGQLIYYYSKLPRFEDKNDFVLGYNEILRSPYFLKPNGSKSYYETKIFEPPQKTSNELINQFLTEYNESKILLESESLSEGRGPSSYNEKAQVKHNHFGLYLLMLALGLALIVLMKELLLTKQKKIDLLKADD